MPLYLLLFVLFLIQEPISSDAALLEAYQYHYNLWIVHGLFVVATLLDIVVGYAIGMWLHKKFSNSRSMHRLADWARSVSDKGTYGEYFFLFLWSWIIFPYATLVAPWLEIPFWKTLTWMFLGDLVFWYGSEWLVVLGVKTFIPNPVEALYGIVIVSILIVVGVRYAKRHN